MTNEFFCPVQVRWSDLDPNNHLRHSVYYDWGAYCRILFLNGHNLTAEVMNKMNIGLIIFREECVFKREIRYGDEIRIDLVVTKAKKDFSRWSVLHQVMKNHEILSARISVDIAWLNLTERKLAIPPQKMVEVINAMPKSSAFEWID